MSDELAQVVDPAFSAEDASARDAQVSQAVGVPEGVEIVDITGQPTGEMPVYEHDNPEDPTEITGWHKAPLNGETTLEHQNDAAAEAAAPVTEEGLV